MPRQRLQSSFSHPRMVEELIRSFVREEFVEDIDFSKLTRTFNSFVTEEFRERESDIIWQVEIKGSTVYFYLLIEFQSTVDRFMVLRLLSYLMLFYLELIKDENVRKREQLPAVFPVLLYSGEETWTAPQSIEELIQIPSRLPSAFIPIFRYYRIAENEWSSESLLKMDNIVSRLFLIETTDARMIGEVVGEAIDVLKREVDPELRRSFGLWLRWLLKKRNIDIEIDIETMAGQEVRTMLEANLRRHEEELLERGRQEGMEKGRLETDLAHAKEMKALNVDREIIKKVTGIDIDTIE
ncbi:MAG: Rpn family recombination-promoting nuclease/putative transposase [Candidatus Xenobiia bacterium LiM19]